MKTIFKISIASRRKLHTAYCGQDQPYKKIYRGSKIVAVLEYFRIITGFDAARYPVDLKGYLRDHQGKNVDRFTLIFPANHTYYRSISEPIHR